MSKQSDLIQKGQEVFLKNYKQLPVVIHRGEGNYVFDADGKKYLDFVAGISTNALGYSYEPLKAAIKEQVDLFTHCSNLYYNEPAIEAAGRLIELSGLDGGVFFCNSGAEANESALKIARRYMQLFVDTKKTKVVSMKNSFHGRTIATVSMTGQTKYQENFGPLFEGVSYTEFNDTDGLVEALTDETAILIIEPIQGEGGIRPAEQDFMNKARALCDEKNIILVFDEVQCGMGRSGEIFAYQNYNIKPDIVTLAKGLGAGFAVGAIVTNAKVAPGFEPGTHATTFGGNPIATTAANVVLKALSEDGILENVNEASAYLIKGLNKLKDHYSKIIDVRGMGLIVAIEMKNPVGEIIMNALDKGLLLINSGTHVIRFVPPLTISKSEIDEMLVILDELLA